MGYHRSTYVIYGVRVPDTTSWIDLEDDPGQVTNNGEVGYFKAGAYDRDFVFLATTWKEVELGELHITPCTAGMGAEDFQQLLTDETNWNDQLIKTAERLGLEVWDGPGWFTIADES